MRSLLLMTHSSNTFFQKMPCCFHCIVSQTFLVCIVLNLLYPYAISTKQLPPHWTIWLQHCNIKVMRCTISVWLNFIPSARYVWLQNLVAKLRHITRSTEGMLNEETSIWQCCKSFLIHWCLKDALLYTVTFPTVSEESLACPYSDCARSCKFL